MTPGAIEKLREALQLFQLSATYHDGRTVTASARSTDALIDAVMLALKESAAPVPCVESGGIAERVGFFAEAVERAVQHHQNKGKGGMRVPFFGDFASAPPSVLTQLQWWARDLMDAATRPTPPVPCVECAENEGVIKVWRRRCQEAEAKAGGARKEALEEAARIVEADLDPLGDMVDTGEPAHLNRKMRRMAREIRALSGSEDKNTTQEGA